MPIKDRVFVWCARMLLQRMRLKGDSLTWKHLNEMIYRHLMVQRAPDEKVRSYYDAFLKGRERNYERELQGLRFPIEVNVGNKSSTWIEFKPKIGYQRKDQTVGKVRVNRKEYFSFKPMKKAEHVYEEIRSFARALPSILEELNQLALSNDDYISFKTLRTLWKFVNHPDNLVVHYGKPELSHRIKRIVRSGFQEKGVYLRRRVIRATSAFDFAEISTEKDPWGKSHSQLIADVIAVDMVRRISRFRSMDEVRLAQWLKDSVVAVSSWTPEQIYHSHPELR